MEIAAIIFISVLFCITFLINVFPVRFGKFRKFDVFNLIHSWSYFAPNPLQHDYHILKREPKKDIKFRILIVSYKSYSPFLFNPQTRINLATYRLASGLVHKAENCKNPGDLLITLNYIALLNYCGRGYSGNIQFAIMKSKGFWDPQPQLIFASEVHEC